MTAVYPLLHGSRQSLDKVPRGPKCELAITGERHGIKGMKDRLLQGKAWKVGGSRRDTRCTGERASLPPKGDMGLGTCGKLEACP